MSEIIMYNIKDYLYKYTRREMLWNTQKNETSGKMRTVRCCHHLGSSFFVVKNTVDIFTPHMLLGFRFTIGCILLAVIFRKSLSFWTRAIL